MAIDLLTGQVLRSAHIGLNVSVPGTASDSNGGLLAFSPQAHMNRPALLMQNGTIYIGFGSHQDTPPSHRWIFSFDAETLRQAGVWSTTPNGMGGAIWQAGSGIVGAEDGSIYGMTGNGEEDNGVDNSGDEASSNFTQHFVQLGADLTVLSSFAPGNTRKRNDEDVYVGSSGPVFLSEWGNGGIVFGGGKTSQLFVLDAAHQLSPRQVFQAGAPLDNPSAGGSGYHHIHDSPVIWRSSHKGMNLYVWPERDYLRKIRWNVVLARWIARTEAVAKSHARTRMRQSNVVRSNRWVAPCLAASSRFGLRQINRGRVYSGHLCRPNGSSATSVIVLKPQGPGLDTNLLITTDRRAYYLRLLSKSDDYVARVAFAYPDEEENERKWQQHLAEQKAQETKATRIAELPPNAVDSMYFNYPLKGRRQHPPGSCFRRRQEDLHPGGPESRSSGPGRHRAGRKQEMVNYRVKDDMYIVDRLFERAELILGSGKKARKVEIDRERKG